ncbi:MAG: class I SAM-dependent methyltransferase [Eubacterium sp.]|nr:class I SAM-dependent methyltransferase [Eubacterium sp.]
MYLADKWTDYEILDTSSGEKLERWGNYTLIRPDPQVIWNTERKEKGWRNWNGYYHRSSKGGGSWDFRNLPQEWKISYRELTFHLKPFAFKHTGIFPEQAVNWDWCADLIHKAKAADPDREIKVLNLFAYTGGATLSAAAAGAAVTHVDSAKGMVCWAKENAELSGLSDHPIRWIVDDCGKFVAREIRRGRHYDAIIMDPPSYGRGPKGEIWKIEDALYPLVEQCVQLFSDDPLFFLINSYTTGLAPSVLTYLLRTVLKERGGSCEAAEIGLPVASTGLVLPCGSAGRWSK